MEQSKIDLIIKLYPNTPTKELAEMIGYSPITVKEIAYKNGVHKTPEQKAKSHMNSVKASLEVRRKRGFYGFENSRTTRFKKGVTFAEMFGKEKWEETKKKIGETNKRQRATDKLRINWGLEQKTGYNVIDQGPAKRQIRYRLRKFGYNEVGKNRFQVPTDGTRRKQLEKNAVDKFGIKFIENN